MWLLGRVGRGSGHGRECWGRLGVGAGMGVVWSGVIGRGSGRGRGVGEG